MQYNLLYYESVLIMKSLLSACTSEDLKTRIEAYNSVTNEIAASDKEEWVTEIGIGYAKKVIQYLKEDICNENKEVCIGATGFLGCVIANERFMNLFSIIEEQDVFNTLLEFLENVKEKEILIRGLWCFAQSKFGLEIYSANFTRILSLIKNELSDESNIILISEALQSMKSLIESIPEESLDKISLWFSSIFPFLFHDDQKIRGIAYAIMKLCMTLNISNKSTVALFKKELLPFIPTLQNSICKKMCKFIEEQCAYCLKIWRLLVSVLGVSLHSGVELINGFLEVVEKAFKSSSSEFRFEAFKCWQTLITNLSLDKNMLCHPKRVKLLIAPFKSNNAKTEDIAKMKLLAWWFLVCQMEDKAKDYFDLVVAPLLKYCFNSNSAFNSGVNERKHLLHSTVSPCRKYSSLHVITVEVLARILSPELNSVNYDFSICENHRPILNSNLFLKNYLLLYGCLEDALRVLNSSDEKQFKLGSLIMQATLQHIVNFVSNQPNKKESVDMVKELFCTFSVLESHCNLGDSLSKFAYKFLELTVIGSCALPKSITNSRLYHISTGTKVRDMMNGTLSNFFIHKLCKPFLLHFSTVNKEFFILWEATLQTSKPDKLVFIETVVEELNDAIPVLCPQNASSLVSLWNITAIFLDSHIERTQLINQGDNSDHDWSCIYNTLLFPVKHSHESFSNIDSKIYEKMFVTWSSLWKHFVVLTSFATTAEPNAEAEYIAQKMIEIVNENLTTPPDMADFTLAFFSDIVCLIVDEFKFKELGKKTKKTIQSPLKPKKKPHPLFNLGEVVNLLTILMEKSIRMISLKRHHIMLKLCIAVSKIFENVPQDRMIWPLLTLVNDAIYKALQINPAAKFNSDVEAKFVQMWSSYCSLVETHLGSKLTKDQFIFLAPLIYKTLQSSHMAIKQRTRSLWIKVFASTRHSIPQDLFEVLRTLGLPPASVSEIPEDSCHSQSSAPESVFPISGSFLRKEKQMGSSARNTPKSKKHIVPPLTLSPSMTKSPEIKTISINNMRDEDFVKVNSPKVKPRILTSHQVDKMKSRACDIPALYNDLSQSLSQLPSQFMTQDLFGEQSNSSKSKVSQSLQDVPHIGSGLSLDKPFLNFNGNIKQSNSTKKSLEFSNSLFKAPDLCTENSEVKISTPKSLQSKFQIEKMPTKVRAANEVSEKILEKIAGLTGNKDDLSYERNGKENKRKSKTPSKKSIEDVRTILKRKLPNSGKGADLRNTNKKSPRFTSDEAGLEDKKNIKKSKCLSPLASPLKTPSKCVKDFANTSVCSITEFDSEEEIPDSQDDAELSNSGASLDRPRRNKRKGRYDDDTIYVTPTKRLKTKANSKDSAFINSSSKKDNVACVTSLPKEKLFNHPGEITSPNEECVTKLLQNINRSPLKQTELSQNSVNAGKCELTETNSVKDCCELNESKISDKSTPSKITRSGRRIIAPNKDMPEPMTPPTGSVSKKISSFNRTNSIDLSDEIYLSQSLLETRKKSTPRRISDSFGEIKTTVLNKLPSYHYIDKQSDTNSDNSNYVTLSRFSDNDNSVIEIGSMDEAITDDINFKICVDKKQVHSGDHVICVENPSKAVKVLQNFDSSPAGVSGFKDEVLGNVKFDSNTELDVNKTSAREEHAELFPKRRLEGLCLIQDNSVANQAKSVDLNEKNNSKGTRVNAIADDDLNVKSIKISKNEIGLKSNDIAENKNAINENVTFKVRRSGRKSAIGEVAKDNFAPSSVKESKKVVGRKAQNYIASTKLRGKKSTGITRNASSEISNSESSFSEASLNSTLENINEKDGHVIGKTNGSNLSNEPEDYLIVQQEKTPISKIINVADWQKGEKNPGSKITHVADQKKGEKNPESEILNVADQRNETLELQEGIISSSETTSMENITIQIPALEEKIVLFTDKIANTEDPDKDFENKEKGNGFKNKIDIIKQTNMIHSNEIILAPMGKNIYSSKEVLINVKEHAHDSGKGIFKDHASEEGGFGETRSCLDPQEEVLIQKANVEISDEALRIPAISCESKKNSTKDSANMLVETLDNFGCKEISNKVDVEMCHTDSVNSQHSDENSSLLLQGGSKASLKENETTIMSNSNVPSKIVKKHELIQEEVILKEKNALNKYQRKENAVIVTNIKNNSVMTVGKSNPLQDIDFREKANENNKNKKEVEELQTQLEVVSEDILNENLGKLKENAVDSVYEINKNISLKCVLKSQTTLGVIPNENHGELKKDFKEIEVTDQNGSLKNVLKCQPVLEVSLKETLNECLESVKDGIVTNIAIIVSNFDAIEKKAVLDSKVDVFSVDVLEKESINEKSEIASIRDCDIASVMHDNEILDNKLNSEKVRIANMNNSIGFKSNEKLIMLPAELSSIVKSDCLPTNIITLQNYPAHNTQSHATLKNVHSNIKDIESDVLPECKPYNSLHISPFKANPPSSDIVGKNDKILYITNRILTSNVESHVITPKSILKSKVKLKSELLKNRNNDLGNMCYDKRVKQDAEIIYEERQSEVDATKLDKDSPEKNDESKFTNCIGTPELKKLALSKAQIPRSRAAMMLACAKKAIRTRGEECIEWPIESVAEGDDSFQVTPTNTPPRKKRRLTATRSEAKPWMKHKPSPNASPIGSILKRKFYEDESLSGSVGKFTDTGEGSPSLVSNRRVSFADPPVSEEVEIPNPTKQCKVTKAQKKLDMTQSNVTLDSSVIDIDSQNDDLLSINPLDCSQPIFPSYIDSQEPIEVLAPFLTSPSLVESLIVVFLDRGFKTVGEFCSISEAELHTLPVRAPKTSSTKKCLAKFIDFVDLRNKNDAKKQEVKNKDKNLSFVEAENKALPSELNLSTPFVKELDELSTTVGENNVISEKESNTSIMEEGKEKIITNVLEDQRYQVADNSGVESFCQTLEQDSEAISSFASALTPSTKEKLFRALAHTMPYKNIIDFFHHYLVSRESVANPEAL